MFVIEVGERTVDGNCDSLSQDEAVGANKGWDTA